MKNILRLMVCFFIMILFFTACEKQEFLSGRYEEQQGMGNVISFADDTFCCNDVLSGSYEIKGDIIMLKYDDGVVERCKFEKTGDKAGDSLWLGSVHYIKKGEE